MIKMKIRFQLYMAQYVRSCTAASQNTCHILCLQFASNLRQTQPVVKEGEGKQEKNDGGWNRHQP